MNAQALWRACRPLLVLAPLCVLALYGWLRPPHVAAWLQLLAWCG